MNIGFLLAIIPSVFMFGVLIWSLISSFGSVHQHIFGHKHGESAFSVDQYAHESKLSEWNAGYKIIISLILIIICVFTSNINLSLFIIVFCAFITVYLGGLSLSKYINLLTIPLFFMIAGSIVILLEFSLSKPADALVQVALGKLWIYCTSTGVNRVIVLWGKAFGAISAMYMLTLSTPSYELFSALERAHCPGLIIELMNMMYRFIFILMDTWVEMNNAAHSRLGYLSFKQAIKTFGMIGGNLLIVSLKKANAYYDALESRLYNGHLSFLEEKKKITPIQIAGAAVLFLYLFLIAAGSNIEVKL